VASKPLGDYLVVAAQVCRAVEALDAIDGGDPEGDHGDADHILLTIAPPEVRRAYERLVSRARWWATA
jgi:hypothetical protein